MSDDKRKEQESELGKPKIEERLFGIDQALSGNDRTVKMHRFTLSPMPDGDIQRLAREHGVVQLSDSLMDVVVKMAKGNPGAATVLATMAMKDEAPAGTPDAWKRPPMPLMYILRLDDLGIYADKIWVLWKDCCRQDWVTFETVMRNHQMGRLTNEDIWAHCVPERGRGIPFENLVSLEELFPDAPLNETNPDPEQGQNKER